MSTFAKPSSPRWYWLDVVAELQAILDPTDPRWDQVLNLCYFQDQILLDTREFCTLEPGNPGDLTLEDLADGAYSAKYLQAAKQAAFYNLCQDIPEADVQYLQVILDGEAIHEILTGGDLVITGIEDGVDDQQLVALSATFVSNSTLISATGTFNVTKQGQTNPQASFPADLLSAEFGAFTIATLHPINADAIASNGSFSLTFDGTFTGGTNGKLVINTYYVVNLRA